MLHQITQMSSKLKKKPMVYLEKTSVEQKLDVIHLLFIKNIQNI